MSELSGPLLVVEDDGALRETLHDVLTEAGFAVALASDGVEAVELLAKGLRPSLILCDLYVPRLSGADLVKRVREDPALQRTSIVIMSGSSEPADDLECECIQEPLNLTELLQVAWAHGAGPHAT